jgi:hypothetical protein
VKVSSTALILSQSGRLDERSYTVDLVSGQIIHDVVVVCLQARDQHLLDTRKAWPFMAPSSTQGALISLQHTPAAKVVVFQ